jgi:hypothetical protein
MYYCTITDTHSKAATLHAPCSMLLWLLPCSRVQLVTLATLAPGTEEVGHGLCSAAASNSRRSVGEHRTATVLDHRLRLYTEVPPCAVVLPERSWGGSFEKQGRACGGKREREKERGEITLAV